MGQVKGRSEADNVPQNIAVAAESRALEAVLRDGIADILDGEVWRGKVVAIAVNPAAIRFALRLDLGDVDGGQGGEGCRGGGLVGRVGGGDGVGVV